MPITFDNLRMFGFFGLKLFQIEEAEGGFYPVIPANVLGPLIAVFIGVGIVAYLLGTINFAIIISKKKYNEDIREYGSGNAGMTNMMRTYGRKTGIITFVLDMLKAVLAVVIGWFVLGEAGGFFAGLCCVLGHCFPVWFGFKGGKGVAVTAATILVLQPLLALFLIIIFVAVLAFSKYLSLGSVMAILMYPVLLQNVYKWLRYIPGRSPFFGIVMICAVLTTVLVVFLHRGNLKRILDHTENKFSFKKKGEKKEIK